MKKFFVGCVLAAMVAMTVVAVSCSKDDDDKAACWYISFVEDGEVFDGYVWATKSELDKEAKESKAAGVTDIHYEKTNHSKEECERQN